MSRELNYRRSTTADVFSPAECKRLQQTDQPFRPSAVQEDQGGASLNSRRSSAAVQLDHGGDQDWLVNRMHPHILRLNLGFQFEISGYSAPQILRYRVGEHYAWHVDMGRDEIATRKLSIIVLLSRSGAYSGGDLEWAPDLGPCSRAQGTLIVFPSFMPHRVTPVSRGERFALVTWVHGDHAFR